VLSVRRDHLPATMVGNSSCRQLKKSKKEKHLKKGEYR
jgi:hypothetical protein